MASAPGVLQQHPSMSSLPLAAASATGSNVRLTLQRVILDPTCEHASLPHFFVLYLDGSAAAAKKRSALLHADTDILPDSHVFALPVEAGAKLLHVELYFVVGSGNAVFGGASIVELSRCHGDLSCELWTASSAPQHHQQRSIGRALFFAHVGNSLTRSIKMYLHSVVGLPLNERGQEPSSSFVVSLAGGSGASSQAGGSPGGSGTTFSSSPGAAAPDTLYRTEVIQACRDPVWNCSFALEIPERDISEGRKHGLHMGVCEVASKRFLTQCTLPFSCLTSSHT